mgnify:CR=1 FL=1
MPAKFELIAPCFFGCESTAKFELNRIGAENIRVDDGRLTFSGGAEMIAAANLHLRTVERVMLLLARYKASTFDELFDGVYSIPWEELIPVDAQFPVKGSSLSSQLSSVPACQSIVKKAIVKRLQYGHKTTTLPETGALYKIRFALRKNVVEVMLDTSGDGLHKRGYRRNATGAPIKETLAAAIADLGRVRRDTLVQDPFCGSGTMVIEAAQKAMNIAPGLRRRFLKALALGLLFLKLALLLCFCGLLALLEPRVQRQRVVRQQLACVGQHPLRVADPGSIYRDKDRMRHVDDAGDIVELLIRAVFLRPLVLVAQRPAEVLPRRRHLEALHYVRELVGVLI